MSEPLLQELLSNYAFTARFQRVPLRIANANVRRLDLRRIVTNRPLVIRDSHIGSLDADHASFLEPVEIENCSIGRLWAPHAQFLTLDIAHSRINAEHADSSGAERSSAGLLQLFASIAQTVTIDTSSVQYMQMDAAEIRGELTLKSVDGESLWAATLRVESAVTFEMCRIPVLVMRDAILGELVVTGMSAVAEILADGLEARTITLSDVHSDTVSLVGAKCGGLFVERLLDVRVIDLSDLEATRFVSLVDSSTRALTLNGMKAGRVSLTNARASLLESYRIRVNNDFEIVWGEFDRAALHYSSITGGVLIGSTTVRVVVGLEGVRTGWVAVVGADLNTFASPALSTTGDYLITDSVVEAVNCANCRIGGDLSIRNSRISESDFNHATIARRVLVAGSTLEALILYASSSALLQLDGSIRDLNLGSAHVRGSTHIDIEADTAVLRRMTVLGETSIDGTIGRVTATHLKTQDLAVHAASADVDMRWSSIDGNLLVVMDAVAKLGLVDSAIAGTIDFTTLGVESLNAEREVNLRNARAGDIAFSDAATWGEQPWVAEILSREGTGPPLLCEYEARCVLVGPDWVFGLCGFEYQGISAGVRGAEYDQLVALRDLMSKDPACLKPLFSRLASVARASGEDDFAKDLAYDSGNREIATAGGIQWVWLILYRCILGFGVYPHRALVWLTVLWGTGGVVMKFDGVLTRRRLLTTNSSNAERRDIGCLLYSLDRLFPLGTLYGPHDDVILGSRAVRAYFAFHTIVGAVILTVLVGGLASALFD